MTDHPLRAFLFCAAATAAAPALADDRLLITHYEQQLSDALTDGDSTLWGQYLDPDVIYAEEDDTYKGKEEMVHEVRPLPKEIGGNIKVELLSYHEDGDTAVALFRQHETEFYYGQTIYANYLLSSVWKKRAEGWRQIEGQILAERTDPPSIELPAADLKKFAGTYKLKDSEPLYTLSVTGGKLQSQRTGRPAAEWNAETRDVFFVKGDPRIRQIFLYDGKGEVTGFVERRESWSIVWERVK